MEKKTQFDKVTAIVNGNESLRFLMDPMGEPGWALNNTSYLVKEAIEGYRDILSTPDIAERDRATTVAAINNCSNAVRELEEWQEKWGNLFHSAVCDSMGRKSSNGWCWHRGEGRDWRTGERFDTNLYIMKDGHTGLHKIGRSINPSTRERTLQAQVPLLEMIWDCGAMLADEAILHGIFAHKRIRGEWFDLSSEDIEYIKSHKWEEGK